MTKIPTNTTSYVEETLDGIALSSGIAIGTGYVLETFSPKLPSYTIQANDADKEIDRLHAARELAYNQIAKLQNKAETLPAHAADEIILLLEAHLGMVGDSRLIRDIETRIRSDLINAEQAVRKEIRAYAKTFSQMEDSYLASRIRDVKDVGRRLIRNLMGHKFVALKSVPKGGIVLAEEITPADTAFMHPDNIGGFVSIVGARQGHAGIMARSLNLPAVSALPHMPYHLHDDSTIIVDGTMGRIIINPTPDTIVLYERKKSAMAARDDAMAQNAILPAQTRDNIAVDVQANLSRTDDLDAILTSGATGIGLCRSEFMFMNRDDIPTAQEQYDHLAPIVQSMKGQTVTIRTMDIGGDKLSPAFKNRTGHEANPALGMRGVRLSLDRPQLLTDQFTAILRAGVHGSVQILIPLITSVDQVMECREILAETVRNMRRDGISMPKDVPPLGVMIETPAAALIADALAQHCEFFSIGTNDLIQYTLAADRTNEHVTPWYQADHPAIINLIRRTVTAARRHKIPVSLCGEMAGDADYTDMLLRLGIRSLSMPARNIPAVKDQIRGITLT